MFQFIAEILVANTLFTAGIAAYIPEWLKVTFQPLAQALENLFQLF